MYSRSGGGYGAVMPQQSAYGGGFAQQPYGQQQMGRPPYGSPGGSTASGVGSQLQPQQRQQSQPQPQQQLQQQQRQQSQPQPQLKQQPQQQPQLSQRDQGSSSPREQALEKKVQELVEALVQKEQMIKELQAELQAARSQNSVPGSPTRGMTSGRLKSPGSPYLRSGRDSGVSQQPRIPYAAVDPKDPIDSRLEEFYNSTGSQVSFKRINRGFYKFGETLVELDIVNLKLMARTEDGWNRGKWSPVEKFLAVYENIERDRLEREGQ